jgi:hypothetical protein
LKLISSSILVYFLAITTATAEDMSFEIVSDGGNQFDCCWIVATGEISDRTPNDFKNFVQQEDLKGGLLRIVGTGTNIPAAMELGVLIRNGNFSTTVGSSVNYDGPWYEELDEGECIAGCAVAFFGGNQRSVPLGTGLRLTQFQAGFAADSIASQTLSREEAIASRIGNQIRTGEVVEYLVEMGIDLRTYTIAASVNPIAEPNGQLISRDLLLEYSIDNASDQPSDWYALPLENWFQAKTEAGVSGRAITLHCSQSHGYVLGFEADRQSIQNIQDAVRGKPGAIEFATSDSQFQAQAINFELIDDIQSRVEFSINERAARSIAVTRDFYFSGVEGGTMRTMFDALSIAFAMRGLQADSALPTRILELCVE